MSNIKCGASIGYAIAPRDGPSVDLLLRHADLALYEAKRLGRGQVVCYSPALSREYEKRVMLEKDLQSALDNDELELRYQPIVDPRSGRTICCEALLRWQHPTMGEIPPSTFVPIAEGTGLIARIGSWVLFSACAEAMHWSPDIKVAVNLSPLQFKQGRDIVDIVTDALRRSGLAARRLELEITETVLIEDTEQTLAILDELRAIGVGISLDDFGTGFASLAYLNDFPFSKVKIDRKFTQNVERSARTAAILKGIAQTAKDLQIELVAEGVEKSVQLDYMRSLGINAIQGYLFSRPLRPTRLRRVISKPIVPSWSLERSGRDVRIDTEALRAAIGGR
jgi:predicted signal transduction protein with EAL and GGDEF domain